MTPRSEFAIERLLRLPARSNLLDAWSTQEGVESGGDAFQALYDALLQEYFVNPGRTRDGVRHASRALRRTLTDKQRAMLLRMEANANLGVGDLDAAVARFAEASAAFGAAGEKVERARTAIGWVGALGLMGDAKEALRVARSGRRLLPQNLVVDRARLEANVGNACLHGGRLGPADEHFREALRRFRKLGLTGEAGVCLLNLGMNAWMRAEIPAARRHLTDASRQLAAAGNAVMALYADTGLAAIELVADGGPAAWTRLQELRERFREVGDERALAWSHREIATVFASLGAYEAAAPEAEQAWKTFDRLGFRDEAAQAASTRGRVMAALDGGQLAMSLLERARRHWEDSGTVWAVRRVELEQARLALSGGRAERALETLRRILPSLHRRSPHGDAAIARGLLAEAWLAQGEPARALRFAERARRDARRYPAAWERPGFAILIARAHSDLGRSREAVRWAQRATRDLESLLLRFGNRRLRLQVGESRGRVYRQAVEIVLRHGGPRAEDLALDLVSKARSPALLEDLFGEEKPSRRGLRSAIARLRDQLLGQDSDRSDTRHRGLTQELERLAPRLGAGTPISRVALRRAWEERGFGAWRKRLDGRQVVLFDEAGGEWSAYHVDSRERVHRVALPELPTALRESWVPLRLTFDAAARTPAKERAAFLECTTDECTRGFAELHRAIWDPIPLEEGAPLVVVPGGELHSMPLEALLSGDRRTVTRVPHPALLRPRRAERRPGRALLLHGPGGGTRREVEEIADTLDDAGWNVRVGDRREKLTRARAGIDLLHVAAHGTFHREGWLLSGLELADGWLGFEQLPRRHLRGALLHFTSCESGRAGIFPGSDLEGWMTAGLAAGARDLALTLWKVDHTSARAFSRAFYRAWAGGAGTAEAAGSARRALQARWSHPFRWAPFFAVS